jgi:drug/metabolite transporter superfamily protein YnfA
MIPTVCLLIASAMLESGGDAMVRAGLQGRGWFLFFGAASLVAYGVVVNQSRIDFGRLMGAYIVVFFVVSQLISAFFFRQFPNPRTVFGGALILAGGVALLY